MASCTLSQRLTSRDVAGEDIAAVLKYIPKAPQMLAFFYVIRLMSDFLNILRRDMCQKLAGSPRREVLKGIAWLLLENPEILSTRPQRNFPATHFTTSEGLTLLIKQIYMITLLRLKTHWKWLL